MQNKDKAYNEAEERAVACGKAMDKAQDDSEKRRLIREQQERKTHQR